MAKDKQTMRAAVGEYLAKPYSRILIPDGDGYYAEVLEFPGCQTCGTTPAETLRNLNTAMRNWIEATLAQGREVPEPMPQEYSGHFPLRLPRSIHRKAAQMAKRDGVSLNTFLVAAIAEKTGHCSGHTCARNGKPNIAE